MDWEHVPFFLAVARQGSLRAAAAELTTTHATVRRHIAALEEGLGTQLFHRAQEGLELTPAGQAYLSHAIAADTHLARARRSAEGLDREASGTIKVSLDPMTAHFLMAPIFARFSALYPEIDLEISLTYAIEDIGGLATDVSIRHAGAIDGDIVARKIGPFALGIYASKSYIERHWSRAGPKGEGLAFIGYGTEPVLRRWIETSPFPKARIQHAIPDPEMHLHMVNQGAGMSFLASWTADIFPGLSRMPATEPDRSRFTWLLLHSDLRRTRRVRLFVDFLADSLKAMRHALAGA